MYLKVALRISELESTDNLSSPYNIILSNRAFERFGKPYGSTLNLHCREDLSCMHMHRKNGSAAKSVPCPQYRRLRGSVIFILK